MLDLMSNLFNILGIFTNVSDCDASLGPKTIEVLHDVYRAVQIAIPILVMALCTVDIVRAVAAQDEKDMQAAQMRALKRVIIGLVVFFVPLLLDVILGLAGLASGTCGIGG